MAQHFAYSRHRRVNFLSLWNWLLEPAPGLGTNAAEQDELKRWNVIVHGRENPLAYSAHLFAFLSAEHALGHDKARPVIDLALDSIGELYKFEGDFAGYPTRWEARSSAYDEGTTPPDRVGDFLVGSDDQYLYSIPATDPRHVPYRGQILHSLKRRRHAAEYEKRRKRYMLRYRAWEPSMDELAGLVGAYAIVFHLVDDPVTRSKVRAQATKLGDYLADHGYLLVRPAGGFTARGATGALPAYEYPMANAFEEITGENFSSRVDFAGALKKAGYLRLLQAPINEWQVAGFLLLTTGIPQAAAAGFLGFVQATLSAFGIPVTGVLTLVGLPASPEILELRNTVKPQNVFRAIAIYLNRDCFDVDGDHEASEVALASLFKEVQPPQRFGLWIEGLSLGAGKYAVYHLPALALSAVDGSGPLVGQLFWGAVARWRASPPPEHSDFAQVSESPFTSALALLHSDGASDAERQKEEVKLVELLDATYDNLEADLPVESQKKEEEPDPKALGSLERTNVIDQPGHRSVLNYLAGLALAWLYERRRRDAGTPVETDRFPVAPAAARFAEWPPPTLPGYVVNRLEHVRQAVNPTAPVGDGELIDVFSTRVDTTGALPLEPTLPMPTANFLGDYEVIVREADHDVYTGIDLEDNDEFEITATGQIHGFGIAGASGPDGWTQLAENPRWPLHTGLDPEAHQFALLGSLGGYFNVGASFPRTRFLHSEPLPLYLRINDDNPGDGSGAFTVTISLWGRSRPIWKPGTEVSCVMRERPGSRRITGIGGVHPDGSSWMVPLDAAIWFVEGGHVFRIGAAELRLVGTGDGRYLRATANRSRLDNLGTLPTCPAP
jgi:hypothetical protein